jgi:hypothetical protein
MLWFALACAVAALECVNLGSGVAYALLLQPCVPGYAKSFGELIPLALVAIVGTCLVMPASHELADPRSTRRPHCPCKCGSAGGCGGMDDARCELLGMWVSFLLLLAVWAVELAAFGTLLAGLETAEGACVAAQASAGVSSGGFSRWPQLRLGLQILLALNALKIVVSGVLHCALVLCRRRPPLLSPFSPAEPRAELGSAYRRV